MMVSRRRGAEVDFKVNSTVIPGLGAGVCRLKSSHLHIKWAISWRSADAAVPQQTF